MTCFYRMSDDRVKMAVLFSTFYPVLQLKTTTQAHAHVVAQFKAQMGYFFDQIRA